MPNKHSRDLKNNIALNEMTSLGFSLLVFIGLRVVIELVPALGAALFIAASSIALVAIGCAIGSMLMTGASAIHSVANKAVRNTRDWIVSKMPKKAENDKNVCPSQTASKAPTVDPVIKAPVKNQDSKIAEDALAISNNTVIISQATSTPQRRLLTPGTSCDNSRATTPTPPL